MIWNHLIILFFVWVRVVLRKAVVSGFCLYIHNLSKSHHQSQVTLTWLRCIKCIMVKALASIFPQNMLNLKSSITFSGRVSSVLDLWWVDWRLQTTFGLPETRWGWCIYCRGNKKHIVCNFWTFVHHFISLIWYEVLF